MIKKITAVFLITLALFLFLGCAQQPVEEQSTEPPATETPQEVYPEAGEAPVNEVETGISDIGDIEEELDSSELDDLEDVLSDIENI